MQELFTIKEIIEYAQKIEQESFSFYTKASEIVSDEEVKSMVLQLAKEEVGHYNFLGTLLENSKVTPEDLGVQVAVDRTVYHKDIDENTTAKEVLEIALKREQNTETLYTTLLSFTNLNDQIIELFDDLRAQEAGHVVKVQNRLDKL